MRKEQGRYGGQAGIVVQKKTARAKPGSKVMNEIRTLQKTTDNLIRRLPFQKIIRVSRILIMIMKVLYQSTSN